jgi:hypothetical protein
MSEQKYETLTMGQALDAVVNGEKVEFRRKTESDNWTSCGEFIPFSASDSNDWQFRRAIPKKKKLVPFTFDTFPRGLWIKYSGVEYSVSRISNDGAALNYGGGQFSFEWLAQNAKLLVIENGKVVGEKPCGLEVEE